MTAQVNNLANLLSSTKEGFQFADIKLFVGSDRSTTAEELQEEVHKAVSQIRLGLVKPVDSIDKGIAKTNIGRFLA